METKKMIEFKYDAPSKPSVSLCSDCNKKKNGNVIFTTEVKKKYKLTEEECLSLPVIRKENSYHPLAAPIRLFIKKMVEQKRDEKLALKDQENAKRRTTEIEEEPPKKRRKTQKTRSREHHAIEVLPEVSMPSWPPKE
jgi:hypothetical protein